MLKIVLLGCIFALMIATYLWELFQHKRNLYKIPIRIHVNGTRGKSSLTRLIASGLRGAGISTLAKTTGTLAQMILPCGREIPIYRSGTPNIIEQIRVVRHAVALGAQALVIECMALEPKLQVLCESKLIQSTHGVITNVRPDHLEVMGPTERDVARAISATIPHSGVLFTGEKKHRELLEATALARGTKVCVPREEIDGVDGEDLSGFTHVEHGENVALALAVCRHLGVDRQSALSGMRRCQFDMGAMRFYRLEHTGRCIIFANAFAANDPHSTQTLWKMAMERHFDADFRIVMVNCRADRSARSKQFARALLHWSGVDHFLVTGQHTHLFAKLSQSYGVPEAKLTLAEGQSARQLVQTLIDLARPKCLVLGVGNIAGIGMELLEMLAKTWSVAH